MRTTIFHGTAHYNLEGFLKSKPRKSYHAHVGRKVFCTSFSFEEASYFALRKTPIVNLQDNSNIGIVLEFIGENLIDKIDFLKIDDPRTLRFEDEVSILNVKKLRLVAFWKFDANGNWIRNSII